MTKLIGIASQVLLGAVVFSLTIQALHEKERYQSIEAKVAKLQPPDDSQAVFLADGGCSIMKGGEFVQEDSALCRYGWVAGRKAQFEAALVKPDAGTLEERLASAFGQTLGAALALKPTPFVVLDGGHK